MSALQKARSGRGRVRAPEDTAGNHKPAGRTSPALVEAELGRCPSNIPKRVADKWRQCVEDWPQLNRRDRQHLLEYCKLCVKIEDVREQIGENLTIVNSKGDTVRNPLVPYLNQMENRADKMVRDFAGTAGTRERARPVPIKKQATVTLLQGGKPA